VKENEKDEEGDWKVEYYIILLRDGSLKI